MKKTEKHKPSSLEETRALNKGILLLVASDILGRGKNIQLGRLLIQKFLHTIPGLTTKPDTIIFINDGVKLVTKDSASIGELSLLTENGVEMLACSTCLERFGLLDKIMVGKISDMYTIANKILNAEKVISI